jgi:hypothetical protein
MNTFVKYLLLHTLQTKANNASKNHVHVCMIFVIQVSREYMGNLGKVIALREGSNLGH